MKTILWIFACHLPVTLASAAERIMVWDSKALFKKPELHRTHERKAKGMRSFFYEGADYKGNPP